MNSTDTEKILLKLDGVLKLLALSMAEDDQTEQIRLLSLAGFQPKEIADTIGTTANNVRVRLSSLRKKAKDKTR